MKSLVFYLLQVAAVSGILYGYYHFFLRNNKFHQYNRFYLLGTLLLSLVLPFLRIPVYFQSTQDIPVIYQLLTEVKVSASTSTLSPSLLTLDTLMQSLYIIVAAIILCRLGIAIFNILRMLRQYPAERVNDIIFVNTSEKGTPYSFFRWMFWNKEIAVSSGEGQHIFRHELYHIRQKHTWDLMLMELLTAFFWINPFFHLIKKEVKAIHEFLADEFAVTEDTKWHYAELLLMEALQTRQRLVTPFFNTQIKRRIAMITQSPSPGRQYFRKAMALPVTALLITLVAVNCTSKDQRMEDNPTLTLEPVEKPLTDSQALVGKIQSLKLSLQDDSSALMQEIKTLKLKLKDTEVDNKIFAKVEIEAAFPGGKEGWAGFLKKNLNPMVPVDKGAPAGEYTVFVRFIVHTDGRISDITPITKHGYGMEQEVLRVMKQSPQWRPAIQNGKDVNAYRVQPVTFSISEE